MGYTREQLLAPNRRGRKPKAVAPEVEQQIIAWYYEGLSPAAIARGLIEDMGLSKEQSLGRETVRRFLKRLQKEGRLRREAEIELVTIEREIGDGAFIEALKRLVEACVTIAEDVGETARNRVHAADIGGQLSMIGGEMELSLTLTKKTLAARES